MYFGKKAPIHRVACFPEVVDMLLLLAGETGRVPKYCLGAATSGLRQSFQIISAPSSSYTMWSVSYEMSRRNRDGRSLKRFPIRTG